MTKLQKLLIVGVVLASLSTLLIKNSRELRPSSIDDMTKVSVTITNIRGNSGGSGTVIESSLTESTILTNAHVCGVVENGGIVKSDLASGFVRSFKISAAHDLCLIKVSTDFKRHAILASEPPKLYGEASVIGHPLLLPNILTKGYFSSKSIIQVLVGLKPCSEEDFKNPDNVLLCMFIGGIPIVKTYEAQVVSSLIQPGSSGSPVFNSNGELSGVVFAGAGQIGFANIVPYEYVSYFLNKEQKSAKIKFPNNTSGESSDHASKKVKEVCETTLNPKLKKWCVDFTKSVSL